ncbi:MAG: hypothetical protein PHT27_07735 [Candidatus Izemoplasmatales bacterium]|nr:hypothetical protein [Candidatus Izemoplasmatales bacterium]
MILGIFLYFGLYISQLAFIWKIDGVHKYRAKKLLPIKSRLLKNTIIHYSRGYNINKERKWIPKNELFCNTIEIGALLMQIISHALYLLFIFIRIIIYQSYSRVFPILQIIIFSLSIAYTIGLMIYQGVSEDRIAKKYSSK